MSSRLSQEAVVEALDSGWKSFEWKSRFNSKNTFLSQQVEFKDLLNRKDPESAVQAVPRRDLYLALLTHNPEDSLEVLPYLSPEQFVAVIDHEAWVGGNLSIHQAIRWLDLYKNLGPDQLYRRFRELDEEYQIALLTPYMELVDEDAFEKLPQEQQDLFTALPCNTLWWRVKGEDARVSEFVSGLVGAAISEDTAYVYSLLSMSASMPPHEQEILVKQFRDARLEEDGFVTYEESLTFFHSIDGQTLFQKWRPKAVQTSSKMVSMEGKNRLFLDEVIDLAKNEDLMVLADLKQSLGFLANGVSSACQVSVDDLVGMKSMLNQVYSLVSFGIEVLADGDSKRGLDILLKEHPKTIFQFALTLVDTLRTMAIEGLKNLDAGAAKNVETLWRTGKFGAACWAIDTKFSNSLTFEQLEFLKGLFNRFPLVKEEMLDVGGMQRVRFLVIEAVEDFNHSMEEIRKIFPNLAERFFQ